MAANTFQLAVFGDYDYQICKPAWQVIMLLGLVPLAQLRALKSVYWLNLFNLVAVGGFWAISIGTTLYNCAGSRPDVPDKIFAHPSDLTFQANTDPTALQVGFPLSGATICIQMFYYQVGAPLPPLPLIRD